jgi:hypothetical protein
MNTEPGLAERQIIIQGGHLNTDRRVTEAQLREALTLIEAELRVDHVYSFRRHKFGKSRLTTRLRSDRNAHLQPTSVTRVGFLRAFFTYHDPGRILRTFRYSGSLR